MKPACPGAVGHDDRRELGGVEDGGVEAQTTRPGVDDLQWEAAPPLLHPEPTQGLSELTAEVIGGADEIGLITKGLRANGEGVRAGTEMAHEPHIGEPARSG